MIKYIVTEKDVKRYEILNQVLMKQITKKEASIILNISYRQLLRIYDNFKKDGLEGLIAKYKNQNHNQKIYFDVEKKIIELYKEIYMDFNVMHFKDKLEENHGIKLSYETLRQLLIKNNFHKLKERKKVYRRRRRMCKSGLLIQMDSSLHNWLPNIEKKYWLIATIDDATNEVAVAKFFSSDNAFTNMSVIRELVERKGLFSALYTDKASHFLTTRYSGLHNNIKDDQDETQIEKILQELGITLINANSPQAKGRIERLFGFFQDRLIKEMKLAQIQNYDEANIFLEKTFLPYYNKKYSHEAESTYKSLPININLDLVFTKRYT